jgi:hypothetical protein
MYWNRKITVGLIIFGTIVCFLFVGFNKSSKKSSSNRAPSLSTQSTMSVRHSASDGPLRLEKIAEQPIHTPVKSVGSINFNLYTAYLNSLCPSLTAAEEDALLDSNNRSPELLAALASLGSKRSLLFLEEALKAPAPPKSALLRALVKVDFVGDRVEIARKLGGAYGVLFEALYLAKNKESEAAILNSLRKASTVSFELPWYSEHLKLQEAAYIAAGRDSEGAKAKILLSNQAQPGAALLAELDDTILKLENFGDGEGRNFAIASLLKAHQDARMLPYTNLSSYLTSHLKEIALLEKLQTKNPQGNVSFLPIPIAEAISEARAERRLLGELTMFANDKPGIYQRLPPQSQVWFLEKLGSLGEVGAFKELREVHPEIFNDPEFAPQGINPESWQALVNNRNKKKQVRIPAH